jgi:uncharacterized protein (TIGR03437 family)
MRRSGSWPSFPVLLAFATLSVGTGVCATLSIPNQIASAGASVIAPVTFSSQGQIVSSVQFDLEWDQAIDIQTATGAQVGSSSKVLYASAPATHVLRFVIVGMNQGPISDGELIRAFISLSPNAVPGVAQINLTHLVAASPDGQTVAIQAASAVVQITTGGSTGSLQPQGILNAASLLLGPVAPGEIVTLLGSLALGSPSSPSPTLLFNGVPAPVIYSGGNQVNAIVPFGIALGGAVNVELRSQTQPIAKVSVPTAVVAPAIFTQTATGTGPGAILNQDLTVNSFANPAPRNSIIMVYGTGFGTLNPPAMDGQIATAPATTMLPVTATIGGIPADVTYAGAAPGLIAGAVQINVRIPAAAAPDLSAPISLSLGSAITPAGVTVSIQ